MSLPWDRRYPTAWRLELFLAICSAWAAVQMWVWPADFVIGHVALLLWPHAFLAGHVPLLLPAIMTAKEQTWAVFCGIAALLKLGGLASRLWAYRDPASGRLMACSVCSRLAIGCTIVGLFMSVVVWTIVAISLAIDAPHSVSPIALAGLALGAASQLAEWDPRRDSCA
jgi:hypothetical protein